MSSSNNSFEVLNHETYDHETLGDSVVNEMLAPTPASKSSLPDLEAGLQSLNFDDVVHRQKPGFLDYDPPSFEYGRGRGHIRGRGRGEFRGRGRGRGEFRGRGRGNYMHRAQTEQPTENDGFQLVERKQRPRVPKTELHEFEDDASQSTTQVKLTSIINNVSHYLELAKEAINCMCKKALNNIQNKQDKITPDTRSMNILGPMFRNDFYVRLNDKTYAFVKESVVKSGKLELDGKNYDINLQDTIRLWDVLCGPNDQPTLFRENNILSLGEKLQKIIQEKVKTDLVAEGKLQDDEPYTPTVWLFLAFRYNRQQNNDQTHDQNNHGASRFINMCWNSDGTAPNSLVKVSDYCQRNFVPNNQQQNPKWSNKQSYAGKYKQRREQLQAQQPLPRATKMEHPMSNYIRELL